ncbi:MAG: hypothetical protein ACR2QT_14035 [Woeseiaceae bacterium]
MTLPYDKSAAVVVLPSLAGNRITDTGLRRWLSRATVRRADKPAELLERVLASLNRAYPDEGLAAMRIWGQTGDRPTVWIAAADPVYLEPRLDHLCLHALHGENMSSADMRLIFDYLQERLAGRERYGFARVGSCGYVRADQPLITAQSPAYVIDGQMPNDHLPSGDETGSYHTLRSEVEMALHDHDVNMRRESDGLLPVNSLWLWGGGFAPEQETEPHPPLFSDDPLLKGYWLSKTGVVDNWPGTIAACLEASVAGFVAMPVAADGETDWLEPCLRELQTALLSDRVTQVKLILADGYSVEIQKSDRWKFWRRNTEIFGQAH